MTLLPPGSLPRTGGKTQRLIPGGLTMAGTVLTGITDGVATLTLNRPERLNRAKRRAARRPVRGAG